MHKGEQEIAELYTYINEREGTKIASCGERKKGGKGRRFVTFFMLHASMAEEQKGRVLCRQERRRRR